MDSSAPSDPPDESSAARWLARRDRGLSAAEQDEYLQWLREDPAHGAELARLARAWSRLDALQHWHPAHSSQPNPDLLAPPRRRTWLWPSALAAAAALAVAFTAALWWSPAPPPISHRGAVIHPGPEHMTLEDGSRVDLATGAKIDVRFTPGLRHVKLVRGEAHFTVAKNAARPFIVEADQFAVRAIGTAFAVQLNDGAVSVLVTEGRVQLDELRATGAASPARHELSRLVAGQEAIIRTRAAAADRLLIRDVTTAEMARALAWQTMRLEFIDLPLREVVAEFNRFNTRKLVIEDQPTGDIIVGGSFRADNLEPFVRLLDLGFGVSAYPRGDEIVLRRRP